MLIFQHNVIAGLQRIARVAVVIASLPDVACSALQAQTPGVAAPGPVADERWVMHSEVLNEDRTVSVRLPPGYRESVDRYPVLYLLDGDQILGPVSGVAEALAWAYRAPALIVVGIHNTQRGRDFTTPWASVTPPGPGQWTVPLAGGADRFLAFLRAELLPEIDRRYRTAPFTVLIGHSLGALCALHAFVAAPNAFSATIALSPPAFWNGDEVIAGLVRLLQQPGGVTGRLFVTRAEREFDDTPRAFGKVSEALRLYAPATLRWQTEVVGREDHGTSLVPGLQAGLEFVFADWRDPQLVFDEGLDSVEAYYRRLTAEYGFAVTIPEGELVGLSRATRDPRESARIFAAYTRLYPRSVDGFAGLGQALQAARDLRGAVIAYARAAELAAAAGDARAAALRRRGDSLQTQLGGAP